MTYTNSPWLCRGMVTSFDKLTTDVPGRFAVGLLIDGAYDAVRHPGIK